MLAITAKVESTSSTDRADATWFEVGVLAVWFGMVVGLVEGAGLLVFQALNWQQWGINAHVSGPIIWISPIVDVALLLTVVVGYAGLGQLIGRFRAVQWAVFSFVFLTIYDWLMVTGRIYFPACIVLAAGVGCAFLRWFGKHERATLGFCKGNLPWVAVGVVLMAASVQTVGWEQERGALASLPPPLPGSPNILVIVVDTLRADHLSCYGYKRLTSPHIDQVAREGALFENAISASSWTFPSHVSLLTGRYLFQHGLGSVPRLPLFESQRRSLGGWPMLSEALERRGYRTAAFSANRFFFTGNLGFARGFTHFEDFFQSPADRVTRTLFGSEITHFYLRRGRVKPIRQILAFLGLTDSASPYQQDWVANKSGDPTPKRAHTVNAEFLRWLGREPRRRPFFAFLNYFDVHMPYGGPPGYPKPGWPQRTPTDQYDDGVRYVDHCLGELMDQLRAQKIEQQTLIIITSDHGEPLGQHDLKYHGNALYLASIHVPLIIRFPKSVPAGMRLETPVSNASIAATVIDFLGDSSLIQFPLPSLKLLLYREGRSSVQGFILSELDEQVHGSEDYPPAHLVPIAWTGPMKSVITPRWHYITHRDMGSQLYDWVHDPGELHNLLGTPEGQRVAAEIRSEMQQVLQQGQNDRRAGNP
jgi:arylsulfatase A-like enzyme